MNEKNSIIEKIKYQVLNVIYGQNKVFNTVFVLSILIFGFWFKLSRNDFAESDYLYGYINNKGETVIKPQFSNAGDFHEGLAYACQHEKCGYIDKTGKFVIKPKFFATRDFHEGLAAVTTIKPFSGYIDKTGKFVIKPKLFWAGDFHEGLAQVSFWDGPIFKDDYTNGIKDTYDSGRNPVKNIANAANIKDGYIDKTGKIVMIFPPCSVTSSDFYDGLAIIQINERYGFIDKKGNMIITPKFNDLYGRGGFPMPVKIDGQWGLIDKTGKFILEPKFEKICGFYESLASVKTNNEWYYIDKTGKVVIKTNFDSIGPFNEGVAPFSLNGKQGYIKKNGSILIEPKFEKHKHPINPMFYEGLAAVSLKNKVNFINKSGKVLINTNFDTADHFNEGIAKIGIKNK